MKKRILSLALALTMALGCAAVPAFAAESKSDEMTRVTLAVKEKLGIGDEYDKFSGDCADFGVFRYWQLSWSKENGGSLDVTADNTGRIISYDRYDPDLDSVATPWNGDGYNPTFPAVTAAQVEAGDKPPQQSAGRQQIIAGTPKDVQPTPERARKNADWLDQFLQEQEKKGS